MSEQDYIDLVDSEFYGEITEDVDVINDALEDGYENEKE